jgi:seryl-tRNA synthetase
LRCVCSLQGDEAAINPLDARGSWTDSSETIDLVLAPAACYLLYPVAAARGPARREGLVFDVAGDCFRREPSREVDRLQSFRMREFVAVGALELVLNFRKHWIERAPEIAGALGLSHRVEAASDPFFGRAGAMVGRYRVAQKLKFELLVPVRASQAPTACMSFNYHRDYFGETWGLMCADSERAQTACAAFGVDRLAIALFATHGIETAKWPARSGPTWGASPNRLLRIGFPTRGRSGCFGKSCRSRPFDWFCGKANVGRS